MSKIGRNDPCPCGSGRKYKKCCFERLEAEALELRLRLHQDQARRVPTLREVAEAIAVKTLVDAAEDDEDLDNISNSVVDLVHERRFDEALALCQQLLKDWPHVVDGLERSAMVHESMGNTALALDFYRQALDFTQRPDQHDGFDDEGRDYYRLKIASLEQSQSGS